MKLFYLAAVIFLLASCKNETEEIIKPIKLQKFLDGFIKQNSNWNQNDIINDQVNDKLEKEIFTEVKNGIIDDFPLELIEINEYKKDSFAVALNSYYIKTDKIKSENVLYNTRFDVIGLISKEKINKLKNNNAYTIKGKFKGFIKSNENNYTNSLVYSPLINISNAMSSLDINLGVMLFEISEFKEVAKL
jgi:hypothetical protein